MPILPPEPDIYPTDLLDRWMAAQSLHQTEAAEGIHVGGNSENRRLETPSTNGSSPDQAVMEIRSPDDGGQSDLEGATTDLLTISSDDLCFDLSNEDERLWWVAYTLSRQEKQLMRMLRAEKIAHYAPMIRKRNRSSNGRVRTSLVPLFSNYVFICGPEMSRYKAVCTGCVSRIEPVLDKELLVTDLRQIRSLIAMDVPMSIESRIEPGERVRIRNGSFQGYEGIVSRRDAETRLLVVVRFMDQGVSVKLDDCQVEKI